jgi:hypothetical protein
MGFSFDSSKDWYCECEATLLRKYKIFDGTKEVNGKSYDVRIQNVKSYSMTGAAKPKRLQRY